MKGFGRGDVVVEPPSSGYASSDETGSGAARAASEQAITVPPSHLRPVHSWIETHYRAHAVALTRYLRARFGAGPPEPEEAVQAAFAGFAGLADPESVRNPGAYLRRMAVNYIFEWHRRGTRTVRVHRDVQVLEAGNADLSPEDILSSKEELGRLNDIIAQLKPKQRIALLLHRVDGLSFVEIAREMGISQSGARLLVDTAFARCAEAMRKGEGR